MITGNYNKVNAYETEAMIIPYQVITGNYNIKKKGLEKNPIIPYQVITGNYNGIHDR